MKFSLLFQDTLGCLSSSEVFQYFHNTLTDSITLWDYYVNWNKVLKNYKKLEVHLHLFNYLVGKENIEKEFRQLLKQYPDVASVIPILLACRDSEFKILINHNDSILNYKLFDFNKKERLTEQEINNIIEFSLKTGILELFKNKTIKSVPDYVLGIEVGLDSNGRKNRGGTTMEKITKNFLLPICQEHNLLLIEQATSKKIKQEWGIDVKVDKSSRRFDFAIKNSNTLYLIETNYYGGGGSKLKSTAGEYKTLFDFISSQGHQFIWITDGLGWRTTLRPLEETFNYINYTLNLKMISEGLLSAIILREL